MKDNGRFLDKSFTTGYDVRQSKQSASEQIVKDIKRIPYKQYSAEENICIVLDGFRGEESIAEQNKRENT